MVDLRGRDEPPRNERRSFPIGGRQCDNQSPRADKQSLRTGKKISVGFGSVAHDANGVGSRFRATIVHLEP
jgi:hypothetical protein